MEKAAGCSGHDGRVLKTVKGELNGGGVCEAVRAFTERCDGEAGRGCGEGQIMHESE